MSPIVELQRGEIRLPAQRLVWEDMTFFKNEVALFHGSPDAPISDLFFFLAGLQKVRRITMPAEKGKVNRGVVLVPNETLSKLKYFGLPIYESQARDRADRIGFIFNDPELCLVGSTAKEDIDHAFAAIDKEIPSSRICQQYGFTREKLERRVDVLSGGELHRLLCLTAIEKTPEVLFVDLTRSNLDDNFLNELWKRLSGLASNGCCIFIAGIKPQSNIAIKTYYVGDDGTVTNGTQHDEVEATIDEQMVALQKQLDPRCILDKYVLEVNGVCRAGITSPVSFNIKAGEIVTIFGPNGCGKTTLGLVITGRCKRSDYEGKKPDIAEGVRPVMALQHAIRTFIGNCLFEEEPEIKFWSKLGFDENDIRSHPRSLGYGKQKLASCALALKRSTGLCILDEPTCGMNFALRKRFVELLNMFPKTAILIFSHDIILKNIGKTVNYGDIAI